MADLSGSLKSIFYALAANTAIAIAKGVAAVITGSGAMFAEAIHSTADAGNQVLLLWGLKRAKRRSTPPITPAVRRARCSASSTRPTSI